MGSKNGKYEFAHGNATLPSFSSEVNGSNLNKTSRIKEAALPTYLHRNSLHDTSLESLSLVWLDQNIHQRLSNIDTEIKLKNIMTCVRIFDRVDACERYVKQIGRMNNHDHGRREKLLIVISTTLAPTIIPHLHDYLQVKYVYIYGKSKTISIANQEWLNKFNKVKGIFNSSRSLIAQINDDCQGEGVL